MGKNLLNKFQKFNEIINNSKSNEEIIYNFIKTISKELESDIVFIDSNGIVLQEVANNFFSIGIENKLINKFTVESQVNNQLKEIKENKINISFDNLYTTIVEKDMLSKTYGVFLPIFAAKERVATLIIYKTNKFEEQIEILNEYISGILGILIFNNMKTKSNTEERNNSSVKAAISTLSYSELEAIIHIFDELNNNEGILIASKIADKAGITRSVIVNALRKLESAGIIETRSLGMKGTHIKILNKYLKIEIEKFKK